MVAAMALRRGLRIAHATADEMVCQSDRSMVAMICRWLDLTKALMMLTFSTQNQRYFPSGKLTSRVCLESMRNFRVIGGRGRVI